MKTVFIEVKVGDTSALTDVQKKINQWTTTGLLIKFQTFTTSDTYLFQVLLKKEGA
jgi:predicted Holliday junction resolvase-like endonuclease